MNEQFDEFFEQEILKNENESDIAAAYNDIEKAIRVVFDGNSVGNEEDIGENSGNQGNSYLFEANKSIMSCLNLTKMTSD